MSSEIHIAIERLPKSSRQWLSWEALILGFLTGPLLIAWGWRYVSVGDYILHVSIEATLAVALFLTVLVAFCGFKMPVFFTRSPFWGTVSLIVFCGHISLLFDSFAVVLLLNEGVLFSVVVGSAFSQRFKVFVIKVAAAVCALTVGGAFWIGELWGLPYYITNQMTGVLDGLPLLVVLTPFNIAVALLFAWLFPVKVEPVEFDTQQKIAAFEFVTGLVLLIITHEPLFCLGVLLTYVALTGKMVYLYRELVHEFTSGTHNAIFLVVFMVLLFDAGYAQMVQSYLEGWILGIAAVISSPAAGGLAPPAKDLYGFYVGLSWLMLGAPMFVFSSLVAMIVFRDSLDYDELPKLLQFFASKEKGVMQEALAYTVVAIPLIVFLAILLYFANTTGLFVAVAEWLGVEFNYVAGAEKHH